MAQKQETEKKKPLADYREGKAKITVWENEGTSKSGQPFKIKSYQISKNYKVGDEWKQSDSFSRQELMQLRVAIDKALTSNEENTENEE